MKRQTNQYDKIFKENIEAVIPGIIKNLLGITVVSLEELPNDVQHTNERKPDVLKKVTDNHGDTFVLQVEFQVVDDPEMVYRMLEYKAMLSRKYRLPIYQYVIFLGKGKSKMVTELQNAHLIFRYNLLVINSINFKAFLNSDQPGEIVLAILANFDIESPEKVLQQIISRLEETVDGDLSLKKYVKQLRILAQLRKLEEKLKTVIMDSIAKFVDEERDAVYLAALDISKKAFVVNLLSETNFTLSKIASLANTTVDFVKNVKETLSVNIPK